MEENEHYNGSAPLREKIIYVLSLIKKGSAAEIAAEIMELDGISTEEGVADLTIAIEKELHKLLEENKVDKLKEHRQKLRYFLRAR
jgi:hypothetical protein